MARRFAIEQLVIALSVLHGIYSLSDKQLAVHNAIVWRIQREADRLAVQAGAPQEYGWHSHNETCGTPDECRRGEFIRTCNRLYAELADGDHLMAIELTMHDPDGTVISYGTQPRALADLGPESPIWRTIHAEDHQGCVDATIDDAPEHEGNC